MIRSFASAAAEHLFRANWAMVPDTQRYDQLDDCFLDLVALDAAANVRDLQRTIGAERLKLEGRTQGSKRGSIASDANASFKYKIAFFWTGSDAEKVAVDLSGAG